MERAILESIIADLKAGTTPTLPLEAFPAFAAQAESCLLYTSRCV